jgi:hypothetical protein
MYKSNFVADQEINMVAFLTEVMIESEFKWYDSSRHKVFLLLKEN